MIKWILRICRATRGLNSVSSVKIFCNHSNKNVQVH